MVLNLFKKYRGRLIFAAIFWVTAFVCFESFRPAAKETFASQQLLRVHAKGIPYLNMYMEPGRCNQKFPLDILTKLVSDSHKEAQAESKITFKAISRDDDFTYALFSYSSRNLQFSKEITSIGGFMTSARFSECYGFLQ